MSPHGVATQSAGVLWGMADLEKELLYRLLTNNFGANGFEEVIYPGSLPPGFSLPLPAECRLLGSMVNTYPPIPRGAQGVFRQDHTRILLDSVLPAPEFIERLRAGLPNGWEELNWPHSGETGFLPAAEQGHLNLQNNALQKSLHITAKDELGMTQVTLDLNSLHPEQQNHMMFHAQQREQQVAVRVPAGARLYSGGGGGGGGGQWQYTAVIETDMPAPDLLSYFGSQLVQAGWTRLTGGALGSVTASTWANDSGGLVLIMLNSNDSGYNANMMSSQPVGEQEDGSSSYSLRSGS